MEECFVIAAECFHVLNVQDRQLNRTFNGSTTPSADADLPRLRTRQSLLSAYLKRVSKYVRVQGLAKAKKVGMVRRVT